MARTSDDDRPATAADVDDICATLPETVKGITWGDRPTWVVPRGPKGRGFCLERAPRGDAVDPGTGEPFTDLLVIRVPDPGAKAALVEDESTPFFTIEHFRRTDAVLVQRSRLGELTVAELREVLTEAWLTVAPRRLAREHGPHLM
jgi:hypothetical protein